MDPTERDELTKLVREALFRTYSMRTKEGELGSVLPLIETQLAWCLQQLRMADEPALPEGKEMNMSLAAFREFSEEYGNPEEFDSYYRLIAEIERRFEQAARPRT